MLIRSVIVLNLGLLGLSLPLSRAADENAEKDKKAEKVEKKAEKVEKKAEKVEKKAEAEKKGQARGERRKRGEKKGQKKEAKKGWAVIQVGTELLVVQGSQVAEIGKRIEEENAKAEKAAKDKKVEKKVFKIIQENLGTQREAEAARTKYKDDLLAKRKAEKEQKEKKEKKAAEPEKKIPDDEVEL
jgi:hypothetical protein